MGGALTYIMELLGGLRDSDVNGLGLGCCLVLVGLFQTVRKDTVC